MNEEITYKSPTLNFAEADAERSDTIRLFKDYTDRLFLIGFCRQEKRSWILKHHMYNVRFDDAKRQGSVDATNPKCFAIDYVILYDSPKKNSYSIYTVEDSNLYTLEQMKDLNYPNPRCDYLVYTLGKKVKFESLNLTTLLEKENPNIMGLPLYLSGRSIFSCYRRGHTKRVGLVDADLLYNGTRHPNLALLKIAGYLFDNNISFELIIDTSADISQYSHIFMSKVFTFTEEPAFYKKATNSEKKKFYIGGTGYYANEKSVSKFRLLREEDMISLSKNTFLNSLICASTGEHGINMATQMPYYHLYDDFVEHQLSLGFKRDKYKDYLDYSIGFLTRKCYRHCPFCVNKLEDGVTPYSKLEWFIDKTRPHVYFWDDNFLAAPYNVWKPALQHLIDNKISFQFRQGLDERQLAESEHGEEMAEMLAKSRYHGDFIYAFDNWKDRDLIERALKIWKRHNPNKGTKFYLFCGFMQSPNDYTKFYRDIWELFQRIKVLMQYRCVGYVMRHEDYHKSPIENFYVQIARWCNQQAFYKKMSFWEFVYRNQTFWEEQSGFKVVQPLKSFSEFEQDFQHGYYDKEDERGKIRKISKPLQTFLDLLEMFPEHRNELIEMSNYKMSNLANPSLWEK